MEVYFEEDDFDGFMEKLETFADIESVHPVYEHHLGHRVVRFYDPDFHIIKVGKE